MKMTKEKLEELEKKKEEAYEEARKALTEVFKAYKEADEWDKALFKELGFECFSYKFHDNPVRELGVYKPNDDFEIKVIVTCYPAMFWRFEIKDKYRKILTVIETGSGSLTDYWPNIEKIFKGMMSVTEIKFLHELECNNTTKE